MASPLILQSDQGAALLRPRARVARRPARTRLDGVPRTVGGRWVVRLLFAVPYALIAWVGSLNPIADTPNAQLIARVSGITWDRADASWIGEIYPPIPTLLAALAPDRLLLGIVGALVAGALLQRVLEIMVQRRFRLDTIIILMIALGANPLFAFTATEDVAAIVGLTLFGVGLADLVRFITWRNTASGFRAGILFMCAVLADQSGLLYVATAAVTAPFLRLARVGQRGARAANVLVIVYPAVAVLASLSLLNWFFLGNPLGNFVQNLEENAVPASDLLTTVFTTPNGWLLIAPVLCTWLIALILRRPGAIAVSTMVFAAILLSRVVGLLPNNSAGNTFIIMLLMAVALIPTARTPVTNILVNVVAVLQIGIAWTAAFNRPIVIEWMSQLSSSVGLG